MDTALEKNKVTMSIRDRIPLFFSQDVETVDTIPPGRFLKGAEKVWRQRYCLAPEFPLFEGHFPGQPVLPALGHVLLARSAAERLDGGMMSIESIGQAKFLSLVEPGAVLDVLMSPSREQDGVWHFQNFCVKDGDAIEAARIKMTLRPVRQNP